MVATGAPAARAAEGSQLIRGVAQVYGLGASEKGEFEAAHELYRRILPKSARGPVAPHDDPVPVAIRDLADLIRSGGAAPTSRALFNGRDGVIARKPLRGRRYVVFSDHHLNTWRHRHNVFSGRGGSHFRWSNLDLYVEVVRRYAAAGYTLVENGDVEDLVVFDPALHPGEFRRRLELVDEGSAAAGLDALDAHRARFRTHLLADVLGDPRNAAYYDVLSMLDADDRLVRLAGNHDWQVTTAWEEAVERATAEAHARGDWTRTFPRRSCFADLLALEEDGRWGGVVLHGHAFDRASSPQRASRHGETISECLGTWFQGADRVWSWASHGSTWAGGKPFRNLLVSGSPTDRDHLREVARADGVYSYPAVMDARRRLRPESPLDARIWEALFEHPIAWDYFSEDPDAVGNVEESVYEALVLGAEWFKYRHTEELMLAEQLPAELRATPPLVVLGHTHEPRSDALDEHGRPVPWYLNSGAAGRFEGLLWGVEVVDGEPFVISWHADPFPYGVPVRQRWSPGGAWRHLLLGRREDLA